MNEDLLADLLGEINDFDFDILLTGMEYADIDSLINNDEALTVIDNIMDETERKHEEPQKEIWIIQQAKNQRKQHSKIQLETQRKHRISPNKPQTSHR